MKPKESAAKFEARQKAGLSIANLTHKCGGAIRKARKDFEEKRDPDERQRSQFRNENELDLNAQLETQILETDGLFLYLDTRSACYTAAS